MQHLTIAYAYVNGCIIPPSTIMQIHVSAAIIPSLQTYVPKAKEPWLQVAQWLKHWPTDLAVPGTSSTPDKIFSTVNGVPMHTAFHYHPLIVLI